MAHHQRKVVFRFSRKGDAKQKRREAREAASASDIRPRMFFRLAI
jgi:hypothetical protein